MFFFAQKLAKKPKKLKQNRSKSSKFVTTSNQTFHLTAREETNKPLDNTKESLLKTFSMRMYLKPTLFLPIQFIINQQPFIQRKQKSITIHSITFPYQTNAHRRNYL